MVESILENILTKRGDEVAKTKLTRNSKQQLGQFMTPSLLVSSVLSESNIIFTLESRILEPSLGEGAFIFGFIEKLLPLYPNNISRIDKVLLILERNIFGVEYDKELFQKFQKAILEEYKVDLDKIKNNFFVGDFFDYRAPVKFDYIIGNPPFGGSFNPVTEDALDKQYGQWNQWKIKKETYAFFTVACLKLLENNGVLSFILSDTFLTISTMQGLRRFAFNQGAIDVKALNYFSDETQYGMAILNISKDKHLEYIKFNNAKILLKDIENTPNYSWKINSDYNKYFGNKKLSDFIVASSGMTVGKNELFLRKINEDNSIYETYNFSLGVQKITLADEVKRARLGKISPGKRIEIIKAEEAGNTRKIMEIIPKEKPIRISLPNKNYRFYNKATNACYYEKPKAVIYWANDGEAVYTFKKSGPWYLHGVGGKPFFKKEGLTWNLIATSIKARYLPEGYILDSGAPVAILKPEVSKDELWFIMGWINTKLATDILKVVINHTKNIQGKDIEKMPYPVWVSKANKSKAIKLVQELVSRLESNSINDEEVAKKVLALDKLYSYAK